MTDTSRLDPSAEANESFGNPDAPAAFVPTTTVALAVGAAELLHLGLEYVLVKKKQAITHRPLHFIELKSVSTTDSDPYPQVTSTPQTVASHNLARHEDKPSDDARTELGGNELCGVGAVVTTTSGGLQ